MYNVYKSRADNCNKTAIIAADCNKNRNKNMATIKYVLSPVRKDGTVGISIMVTKGNERKNFAVKSIRILPGEYSTSGGRTRITAKKKRLLVERMVNTYEEKLLDIEDSYIGVDIGIDNIVDILTGKKKTGDVDFFEFAEEFLSTTDIKGKKNYATMLNSLARYIGVRRLPFACMDFKLLDGYMRSLADKPRAQTLYLGAIRHLHNQARLRYNTDTETIISPTLFERFKVPRQSQKGQRAVSVDVLRKVIGYAGTGRAQLARDCFVLSFLLMGMNSADMYDTDAVLRDNRLCYHRKKTRGRRTDGAYIEIDVLPDAAMLMEKYKGKKSVFSFRERYCNEQEFNRALNKGLKKMCEDLGIEKLQFYQARHTWASVAYNELNIDKGVVNDALIHIDKDMRVTDLYIKKDFARINEANRKVTAYVSEG